tara:strand:- start:247 stop:423 length:177 start_codon:yes stop_codon:yes gene_type:complete
MSGKKKQEYKKYLDKRAKDGLLSECERMANYYEKYKFTKQAKKIRNFKKQVREMVGSL